MTRIPQGHTGQNLQTNLDTPQNKRRYIGITHPHARQQKPVANSKNVANQTGARKCQKKYMKRN